MIGPTERYKCQKTTRRERFLTEMDRVIPWKRFRCFVGIELGEDWVPDASSILLFRHLLEKHDLTKAIFDKSASS